MRSLKDIVKELEVTGFSFAGAEVVEGNAQILSFYRFSKPNSITIITIASYVLPPDLEWEEEEEGEPMVYSQEEMEFIRRELSSRYPLEDVDFWLEKMPDIPLWLREKVLKRRGVMP